MIKQQLNHQLRKRGWWIKIGMILMIKIRRGGENTATNNSNINGKNNSTNKGETNKKLTSTTAAVSVLLVKGNDSRYDDWDSDG